MLSFVLAKITIIYNLFTVCRF